MMILTSHRLALAAAFFSVWLGGGAATQPAMARGYKTYAERMLRNLPRSARVRPDLERYLDRLAIATRRRAGIRQTRPNALLRRAARAQAVEMLRGNFVGHSTRSGYSFRRRIEAYGGGNISAFAENAARDRRRGPVTAAKARRLFAQWLNSSGHRGNLMNRQYIYVTSGVVQYGHHLYAIQLYWGPRLPKSPLRKGLNFSFGR